MKQHLYIVMWTSEQVAGSMTVVGIGPASYNFIIQELKETMKAKGIQNYRITDFKEFSQEIDAKDDTKV